jgi:hypothetical protein
MVTSCLQAAASVTAPFLLDNALCRRPHLPSHLVSVTAFITMGATAALLVPLATSLPAVFTASLAYGASQSVIETLIYKHLADRADVLGTKAAAHVSMIAFFLFYVVGSTIGSYAGGAAHNGSDIIAATAVASAATLFGIIVGLMGHLTPLKSAAGSSQPEGNKEQEC